MLIILSPSKSLDFKTQTSGDYTTPDLLEDSQSLIDSLRGLSLEQLSSLMGLSHKLTELNYNRYKSFNTPFTRQNAKQAVYAFKGDVYDGLNINDFSKSDIQYAQDNLRILSGLYGLLRPLDLIQPYRLEMGTKLKNKKGKNLYEFWGNKITEKLNQTLKGQGALVNLASNEYYKAVKPKLINTQIITPVFKEHKNGEFKVVMLYAKKARGMMANYIIKHKLKDTQDIKNFDAAGYQYSQELSNANQMVFVR